MSIIGSALFVSITLSPLLITWQNVDMCRDCAFVGDKYGCSESCIIPNPAIVFAPFLVLILIECIVGIILSSISCCRLCSCCGCCYGGDANTPNLAFRVFSSPQTPYYHLRDDDIQHTMPQHNAFYVQPQQNVI
uniref:Uncharacterized protein n=1 Tax=Strigamia maritima TaxID=126957 RepID=T1IWN3_STRMM